MEGRAPLEMVLSRFAIGQPGALWVFLLLLFVVAADWQHIRSRRNVLLGLLMFPALPMIDSLSWVQRDHWLLAPAFAVLYVATATMAVYGLSIARRRLSVHDFRPNLPVPALRALFVLVLLLDVTTTFGQMADDAGTYTSLGAQRWVETGTMPFGDAKLKGPDSPAHGAAATYGPLLYVGHLPFIALTGGFSNPPDATPMAKSYVRPNPMATQLTCFMFFCLGLWALFGIGRRLGGEPLAYMLVILFAGSSYILGLGSDVAPPNRQDPELAGGLVYISHIAPTAMMLLAMYFAGRPFLSGGLLAAGAGVLFFPAFIFPAYFGWHFFRDRAAAIRFAAGFALVGAAIALLVITCTDSLDGKGPVKLLLESTLEHQEGFTSDAYGKSEFSFWGNFPGLASFWQQPLIGTTSVFKPTFMLFVSYCLGAFFLMKGRNEAEFAAQIASLTAALQLWKTHASGTYVEWYLPFLLIGLLGAGYLATQARKDTPEVAPS